MFLPVKAKVYLFLRTDETIFVLSWWLLDPECAFKINLNNSDVPLLINTCTKILDLDEAQDLDRRKMMQ